MSSVSVSDPAVESVTRRRTPRIVATPTQWVVWGGVIAFMIFLMGTVGSVLVNSFGRTWFNSWWPQGFTTQWYGEAWTQFDLSQVFLVTLEVTGAVLLISLLIGVPASYVLARKNFPGKGLLNLLFLMPIMVPPITYGIPLATALYRFGLAGNMSGVILANLVPSVPFVIMTMTPFVEQLDPALENAARMCGAGTGTAHAGRVLQRGIQLFHERGHRHDDERHRRHEVRQDDARHVAGQPEAVQRGGERDAVGDGWNHDRHQEQQVQHALAGEALPGQHIACGHADQQ